MNVFTEDLLDSYLSWNFELFHHPELEEAADAALDQFQLGQREVAEVELVQLHLFGVRDVGFLCVSLGQRNNMSALYSSQRIES